MNRATTRAYLTAGLDQADGGRLRDQIVDDNGGPCDVDLGADVTGSSLAVADRDGDGHTEVTAGWWSSCRGDPGPIRVVLTLFTRGKHYQLTGSGQLRSQPLTAPFTEGVSPLKPAGVPAPAQWAAGLYAPTVARFHELYL